jgi:hypothetical protein
MLLINLCIPRFTKTCSYRQCNTSITAWKTDKSEFDIFKEPVPCLALGTQPIGTECRRNCVREGASRRQSGQCACLNTAEDRNTWISIITSQFAFMKQCLIEQIDVELALVILFSNRGMCKAICWLLSPCGPEFKLQNSQPHLRRFKTVSFLEAKRPEREADNVPYASKDINKTWGFT